MWIIEKEINKGDYKYARVPNHPKAHNNYVLYHRIVMENHLGRPLLVDEVVHHVDENKYNNSIENLEVMGRIEHLKLHSKKGKTMVKLICKNCDKEFEREIRQMHKKNKNYFCSKRCNGLYNGFQASLVQRTAYISSKDVI